MGNPLFGDWGDAARAAGAKRVDTPIGETCPLCTEKIAAGDVGEMVPHLPEGAMRATHRECMMLSAVGCMYGVCRCTNYAGEPTRRKAALELFRRVVAANEEARTLMFSIFGPRRRTGWN